jgi:hypothetical protein
LSPAIADDIQDAWSRYSQAIQLAMRSVDPSTR